MQTLAGLRRRLLWTQGPAGRPLERPHQCPMGGQGEGLALERMLESVEVRTWRSAAITGGKMETRRRKHSDREHVVEFNGISWSEGYISDRYPGFSLCERKMLMDLLDAGEPRCGGPRALSGMRGARRRLPSCIFSWRRSASPLAKPSISRCGVGMACFRHR